jgi:hypothetical protein
MIALDLYVGEMSTSQRLITGRSLLGQGAGHCQERGTIRARSGGVMSRPRLDRDPPRKGPSLCTARRYQAG